MEFIQHSISWCKGEIFEARIILLSGLILVTIALLFYFAGTTSNAKAMLFPLLAVGILFTASGTTMLYTNPKRITEFSQQYQENATAFIQSEKERADEFISWYPMIRYVASGLGILGIVLFVFWAAPIGRAIGIALIIMMLATYVIDHFSEERANAYYEEILKAVENK